MSYEDRITFHTFDMLYALRTKDSATATAAHDRLLASDVDPAMVIVKLAGMLEETIKLAGPVYSSRWGQYVADQLEASRLIAAADLPPEPDSPFGR